jgi:hypothetical protein
MWLCICTVYPPINFWMPEKIFMNLGMYVMARESISTAYFINPSHQCVCVSLRIVARQRFGRHVPVAMNTRNNRELLETSFYIRPVSYQGESVGLCVPLSLRGSASVKTFPRQRKNCWTLSFLCDPCRIKEKQAISSSRNFMFSYCACAEHVVLPVALSRFVYIFS